MPWTGIILIAYGICLASVQAAVLPDCAAVQCVEVACLDSYVPPGECCPVCQTAMPPPDRCALVRCAMPADCVDTYIPPGQCCPVCRTGLTKPGACPKPIGPGICVSLCKADSDCPSNKKCCSNGCGQTCQTPVGAGKDCYYKGSLYHNGQTFKDDCNTCTCKNGFVSCTEMACGIDCYYKGSVYKDGERFKDDCNTCTCHNGAVGCTKIGCVSDPCKGRVCPMIKCIGTTYTPPGQCCPVCKPTVRKPDCSEIACLDVYCEGQYTKPGDCCPSCPNRTGEHLISAQ